MKKVLVGIVTTIAIIVILIIGKIKIDAYKITSIAHGEEAKAVIEDMLKGLDEKALTSEGGIKSYKIDDSYTEENPMGGINLSIYSEWR